MNAVSGSMAHGNYAEAMEKINNLVIPVFTPKAQLSKGKAKKITFGEKASGAEILEALSKGSRIPVVANPESDIYESYIAAFADGYVAAMDELIEHTLQIVESVIRKTA